jgi:sugar phosphate isomerase/epimerase
MTAVSSPRFGVSTHLFHDLRLDRAHLVEIAARGFDCVEVFATRSHFDYHDSAAVRSLAEWLDDTRLALNSIHAPITSSMTQGASGEIYSNATPDETGRQRAIAEAEAALAVAQTVPFRYLVVHLGVPDGPKAKSENSREAARRSVLTLHERAQKVGVRLALEVIPNALARPDALVAFIEEELDGADVGICLDVGHAFLMGEPADAIETCAEYLLTTHLHDNHGTNDDHLAPGEGAIDWAATLMALQKVGYEGALMFEVANTSSPEAVLASTEAARQRFEKLVGFNFGVGVERSDDEVKERAQGERPEDSNL